MKSDAPATVNLLNAIDNIVSVSAVSIVVGNATNDFAVDWGCEGRWFESSQPDSISIDGSY